MSAVYFARHVHDWECPDLIGSVIEHLYKNSLIGVWFDAVESWNEADYSSIGNGRSAIRYMNRCNEDGDAIVFATYKLAGGNRVVWGRPLAGSKAFFREHLGRTSTIPLKTLRLANAQDVPMDKFPYAHLLAPQQSTFVRWSQCEHVANRFVDGMPPDIEDPRTFMPAAIEVLCVEYLRRENVLHRNLVRTGGTLKHFDIVGLDSGGKRVLAQVKARSDAATRRRFANTCRELDKDGGRWFFFADGLENAGPEPGVTTESIHNVLQTFLKNDRDRDYLTRVACLSM